MSQVDCPDLEALDAFVAAGDDGSVFARHVARCPTCRVAVGEIRANLSAAADVARLTPRLAGSSSAPQPLRLDTATATAIPGFTLGGVLGRGGMGVVYEAIQDSPRRAVALKIAYAPVDGAGVLARMMEQEVAALARLSHANIATIFGAGQTADGRPWFAMELVRGMRLQDMRRAQASPADVVRLFLPVCDAMAYAHGRGVIHRDLKPSNILVSERGAPKVLDFGLARLLGDEPASIHEGSGDAARLQGTLPYMSPEQARGRVAEMDARSDVYSLGVVLFELLTGRLPYEVDRRDLTQAVQAICNAAPPDRFVPSLGRDLELVVLKALAKSPADRYASASALADDLRRVLDRAPISARPLTVSYLVRTAARRHPRTASAVAGLSIVVLAFGLAMAWFYASAAEHAARAGRAEAAALAASEESRAAAARAERVTNLLSQIFRSASPGYGGSANLSPRELLDAGADRVLRTLDDDPLARAALLTALGGVYRDYEAYAEAAAFLTEALALREAHLGPDHPRVAETATLLGMVRALQGDAVAATPPLAQAHGILSARLGADDWHALEAERQLAANAGDAARYEAFLRAGLERISELAAPPSFEVTWLNELGGLLCRQERYAEAIPLMQRAAARLDGLPAADGMLQASINNNLAWVLVLEGRAVEAQSYAECARNLRLPVFPGDHLAIASSELVSGAVLLELGAVDEAEERLANCLRIRRAQLPPEDDRVLEAEDWYERCLARR